jgi:hypothetical protein
MVLGVLLQYAQSNIIMDWLVLVTTMYICNKTTVPSKSKPQLTQDRKKKEKEQMRHKNHGSTKRQSDNTRLLSLNQILA